MKPLSIVPFVSGKLQSNSYVVSDEESFCVVIDPGEESTELLTYIGDRKVDYILLTHGHYDHIGGVTALKEKTDASVAIHYAEAEYLSDPVSNLSSESGKPVVCEWPDILLNGGELVQCGKFSVKVIHTPGHSPGSVCYLLNDRYLFSGDTLLAGLVGPTNLPSGNRELLKASIKEKLYSLSDHVEVYPGHGEPTKIGAEKKDNLFPNIKAFF